MFNNLQAARSLAATNVVLLHIVLGAQDSIPTWRFLEVPATELSRALLEKLFSESRTCDAQRVPSGNG